MLSERSQRTRGEFTPLSLNCSNSGRDVFADLDWRNRGPEVGPGTQLCDCVVNDELGHLPVYRSADKSSESWIFLGAKQGQLDVSQQNSVAAATAYCFVTTMLFALVVSVNPAVWLVTEPT
jgi:hypothetical protein